MASGVKCAMASRSLLHTEKLVQVRRGVVCLHTDFLQGKSYLCRNRFRMISFRDLTIIAEHINDWLIGNRAAVGKTTAFEIRYRLPAKRWRNSYNRRDLPWPASATIPTTCPCPTSTCAISSSKVANSRSRPTNALRLRSPRLANGDRLGRIPITLYIGTSPVLPLTLTGFNVSSRTYPCTKRLVLSLTKIVPGSASAQGEPPGSWCHRLPYNRASNRCRHCRQRHTGIQPYTEHEIDPMRSAEFIMMLGQGSLEVESG